MAQLVAEEIEFEQGWNSPSPTTMLLHSVKQNQLVDFQGTFILSGIAVNCFNYSFFRAAKLGSGLNWKSICIVSCFTFQIWIFLEVSDVLINAFTHKVDNVVHDFQHSVEPATLRPSVV